MTWTDRALCTSADPDLFHPSGQGSADGVWAYRICFDCPVIDECLDAGMDETHGIWAATTPRQRIEIRAGRATAEDVWEHNRQRVQLFTGTRCEVDGCERPRDRGGLCYAHYRRERVHGTVDADVPVGGYGDDVCKVDGCRRDSRARGWCDAHYRRWRTRGDTFPDVPIGRPGQQLEREAS